MSLVYSAAIARINRRYDRGRGVIRFDRPVISVGNLSVGGTGKTPMVAHILRTLLASHASPCVAMRGYRSRRGESDEAEEYRRAFPTVPIVAQPDRTHGLISLFSQQHELDEPASTHIILDDGFQHRRIARDVDIVLIDATADPFTDRLLPAGRLREPTSSLSRASAIVLTHAEAVTPDILRDLARAAGACQPAAHLAITRHAWTGLFTQNAGQDTDLPLEWLVGKSVLAACAIGRPAPFLRQVSRAADLRDQVVLPDHDPFTARTVLEIAARARAASAAAIIVTEKDWSKLRHIADTAWPCPVIRPRLTLEFDSGEDEIYALIHTAELRSESHDADAWPAPSPHPPISPSP
jgi:tetraacyldisaccharide 4'-kinase